MRRITKRQLQESIIKIEDEMEEIAQRMRVIVLKTKALSFADWTLTRRFFIAMGRREALRDILYSH